MRDTLQTLKPALGSPAFCRRWRLTSFSCGDHIERAFNAQPTNVRIMIVEDDVLLAMDLAGCLRDAGLDVVGPFASVEVALQGMTDHRPHIAILDIDLNGQMSFLVADALATENVPFVWLSGSSPDVLPEHHRHRPFLTKPFASRTILRVMTDLLKTP